MLVEAGGRCVDQDLVLRCIVTDHAGWSGGMERVVWIEIMSCMGEEVSRRGSMVGRPETIGACEWRSTVIRVGIIFSLQSIALSLCCR